MKNPFSSNRNRKAFSLVEMLSVIGVIGIISAIAIPSISRIRESADDAVARRNAQNLASVFVSAQAAGVDLLAENDLASTVANIVSGGVASDGVFDGSFFGLPGLSGAEQISAMDYLMLSGSSLLYQSEVATDTITRDGTTLSGGSDAWGDVTPFGDAITNNPSEKPTFEVKDFDTLSEDSAVYNPRSQRD